MQLIQISESTYIDATHIVKITMKPCYEGVHISVKLTNEDNWNVVSGKHVASFIKAINRINKSAIYLEEETNV